MSDWWFSLLLISTADISDDDQIMWLKTPSAVLRLTWSVELQASITPETAGSVRWCCVIEGLNSWYELNISVKEQVCSEDIKLSAVSMRPYYLHRCVYIPPSANADAACYVLHSVTSSLQTQHPQALFLFLISGDFNQAPLSSTLPTFTQYVTCHTRDNKTLNLLYVNIKESYNSSPLPPLGRSD